MELTAVFKKVPEGYIAWVEDLPGANTQGRPWKKRPRTFARPSDWSLKPTAN
jgi:hypothetical protein